MALVALLSAVGIYKIASHLPYWKDRYALFEHDLQLAPQNARMRKNHGGSLARKAIERQTSNVEEAKQYAAQAIEHLDYSIQLYPGMATGHIHKGNMHIILQQYDEAKAALEAALKLDPPNYYAKASLGNIYYRKSEYENCVNILESIPKHLRNPSDLDLLAKSYDRLGNTAKAAEVRAEIK